MIDYISSLPSAEWEQERPRRLCVLGSTGSIGVNGLHVVETHEDMFEILALAAGRNVKLLAEQAFRWRPRWLAVQDSESAAALKTLLPADYAPHIEVGAEGYAKLASLPEVSCVLAAQVGAAGLPGAVAAALSGKVICLANKESLVLAGDLLRKLCRENGAVILPVDSEHNAVFQGVYRREKDVKKIHITASGGPFRGKNRDFLSQVTPEQALNHPNWKMGSKVTIDSATLMNKGLEVIEACHLYGTSAEEVGVFVHPQSIVRALVEFKDGSLMAHTGMPDMRMPIAHCLLWPLCADVGVPHLDLVKIGTLTFDVPDMNAFPCLPLALRAFSGGADLCVAMNAANEIAVNAFLAGRLDFTEIPLIIEKTMNAAERGHTAAPSRDAVPEFLKTYRNADAAFARIAVIEQSDSAARRYAEQCIVSR